MERYREVATILTGDNGAEVSDGIAWIQALGSELAVPGLASYGMAETDLSDVVAMAMPSSSMKGNPITLTESELTAVLNRAL